MVDRNRFSALTSVAMGRNSDDVLGVAFPSGYATGESGYPPRFP